MYLKALMGVAILAFTTVSVFAQGQAPKPTLADVQHLAEGISGDKSKRPFRNWLSGVQLIEQRRSSLDVKL